MADLTLSAPSERHKKGSEVLLDMLSRSDQSEISIRELIHGLGERAFGVVLLLFALPNCIPSPVGLGPILGPPLIFFGAQMVLGRREPWLPESITRRRLNRGGLLRVVERALPWLRRLERICRPRLVALTSPVGEKLIGAYVVIMGISIAFPVPLSNFVPAVAVIILAIALMEEDGVTALIGYAVGVIGLAITTSVLVALGAAAFHIFG